MGSSDVNSVGSDGGRNLLDYKGLRSIAIEEVGLNFRTNSPNVRLNFRDSALLRMGEFATSRKNSVSNAGVAIRRAGVNSFFDGVALRSLRGVLLKAIF